MPLLLSAQIIKFASTDVGQVTKFAFSVFMSGHFDAMSGQYQNGRTLSEDT